MDPFIYVRATYSLLTIYMIVILFRWLGPWLSLEVTGGRLVWIARITDPLITRIRNVLPNLGPVDFAPIVAVVLVWFVRTLSTRILDSMASQGAF